ncbi:hypothetical protein FB45DRAFT_1042837 [Roridomyces roridus]|uniref:Uncharacterized protein n=1 Tax=Roridomyces roridus TaxID=1738132 RepID=A0AAD7AZ94_9AGAR|nr:hypothetical protein FB45DRAFT_1042837 [Roridomyces roridus]
MPTLTPTLQSGQDGHDNELPSLIEVNASDDEAPLLPEPNDSDSDDEDIPPLDEAFSPVQPSDTFGRVHHPAFFSYVSYDIACQRATKNKACRSTPKVAKSTVQVVVRGDAACGEEVNVFWADSQPPSNEPHRMETIIRNTMSFTQPSDEPNMETAPVEDIAEVPLRPFDRLHHIQAVVRYKQMTESVVKSKAAADTTRGTDAAPSACIWCGCLLAQGSALAMPAWLP